MATTFLIAFFSAGGNRWRPAGNIWILCSVGIALALFGVVLTYYSSVRVFGDASSALNMTALIGVANQLDPRMCSSWRLFSFSSVMARKWAWFPMHTWLPDAYSEAPAPIAAMLAGVLETVAVYTVLRSKALVDQALPRHTPGTCSTFGLLSFVVASLFILIQHNYKRLFAYSSIEHMGLAMIGFGSAGRWGRSPVSFTCSIMRWPRRWRFCRGQCPSPV